MMKTSYQSVRGICLLDVLLLHLPHHAFLAIVVPIHLLLLLHLHLLLHEVGLLLGVHLLVVLCLHHSILS